MRRGRKRVPEMFSLSSRETLPVSLEALEARLESQVTGLHPAFDDALCLYYLCTTRCSGTKCPAFCPCDVVLDLGGIADGF